MLQRFLERIPWVKVPGVTDIALTAKAQQFKYIESTYPEVVAHCKHLLDVTIIECGAGVTRVGEEGSLLQQCIAGGNNALFSLR